MLNKIDQKKKKIKRNKKREKLKVLCREIWNNPIINYVEQYYTPMRWHIKICYLVMIYVVQQIMNIPRFFFLFFFFLFFLYYTNGIIVMLHMYSFQIIKLKIEIIMRS